MAFRQRSAAKAASGPGGVILGCCKGIFWGLTRIVLTLSAAVLLIGALLILRLTQGPLELPGVGRLLAEQINNQSDDVRVSARTMVLTLGEGRAPSGLEFIDVSVVSLDGTPLFSVPRVGTSFQVADLVQGHVRPVRFTIIEPDAQFIRAPDGRIRFGLGYRAGIALSDGNGAGGGDAAGLDAVNQIIDSFVGDAPPIDELVRLERIEIIGANLIYSDRMHGGNWTTRDADLRIWRGAGGAQAVMTVDDIRPDGQGAALRVWASRRKGEGDTRLRASFGRLDTAELARRLPGFSWLDALGATLEGALVARVDDTGRALDFGGEVIAERGRIGGPDGFEFQQITARFKLDPETGDMGLTHARVLTEEVDAEIAGVAGLSWPEGASLPVASAQIDIGGLRIVQPEAFEQPLAFDRGQIALRWVPARKRVEITNGWLGREDLTIQLDGQISTAPPVLADLRAEVPEISARELEALWPLDAAPNARVWFARNILKAGIRDLVIQARVGPTEPVVTFDFTFDDLDSTYIKGMSPIRAASGRAHLNYHELHLVMDKGHVQPGRGQRLDLAGSRLVISDFNAAVTPAYVDLVARGPTAGVLALIDEKPLGLIRKLGVDLGTVGGTARVTADLRFPLVDNLRIDQVQADARARLNDVRMNLPVAGEKLDIRSKRLDLAADTRGLSLEGRARIEGTPVTANWAENFRASSRELRLKGDLTPELLARFGASDPPFSGKAPFDLGLTQKGNEAMGFTLTADLGPSRVELAPLGWVKAPGARGRLTATGVAGTSLKVDKLVLDTASLKAEGAVSFARGEIEARFARVRLPGRMDAAVNVRAGPDGVPQVWLTGRYLDFSSHLDDAGGSGERGDDRFSLRFDVKELRVSEKVALKPAKGSVSRGRDATLLGEIDGRLGPRAPIRVEFNVPQTGEGRLLVTSPDAGEALRAADLYREAEGGSLWLSATLGGGADMAGQVRIEDVRVRSKSTFQRVLKAGGLEEAEQVVTRSGIAFRKIWVPFSYDDGVVTLTDAIAVSPMLGLKLNGTLNEKNDQLDMIGVMSPAYALTGALNNVPVLGQIFAGGEGEGILAMTFTLRGAMRDPRFSVNPLSILTPGFLRRLFTRGAGDGARDRGVDFKPPQSADR